MRLLAVEVSGTSRREGDVRVTTAFTRLLCLPGASVIDVSFGAEAVIVPSGCGDAGGCAPRAGRPARS